MKPEAIALVDFRDKCRERIPTAEEFLAFVESQGWRVAELPDGRPALKVHDKTSRLAQGLAKMLAREPYRSNVLAEMARRWRAAAPQTTQPVSEHAGPPREWLWRYGQQYREDPRDTTYGHEDRHPVGAWWWRRTGETAWRPVPGRTPPGAILPEGEVVAHEEGGQLGPGPGPHGDPGRATGGPDAGDAAGREPGGAGRDSQPSPPEHALAAP